jgi:general secretion pathway protein A
VYERHFGLTAKPFPLLPQPDAFYASRRHKRALDLLEYGIRSGAPLSVITGEVGTGKTTLLAHFIRTLGSDIAVGLITSTHFSLGDPLEWVIHAFDIAAPRDSKDPVAWHHAFVEFALRQYALGRRVILFIDEAQNYGADALEKLRLLSNINSAADLLLQMVLVGQPELLETLRRPELRQFAQRIAASHHLGAFEVGETARYIAHRLAWAGGSPDLFTTVAVGAVQYFAGGIPRLINALCDMALVYGYADNAQRISIDTIIGVVRDREASGLNPFRPFPAAATAESDRPWRLMEEIARSLHTTELAEGTAR